MENRGVLNDVNEWIDFKKKVIEMYPTFFEKLLKKHPDLTSTEIKVCTLLIMESRTKEIAHELGADDQAVNEMRSRLRKKFGLKGTDGEIVKYLRLIL